MQPLFGPPPLASSTKEERQAYIEETYHCINDCDMCGLCKIYHGKEPVLVYRDYIEGTREFADIAAMYRPQH
ncbi:MAG: hypothetical protein ACI4OJ_05335 [Lachnospiraceae bacterium]